MKIVVVIVALCAAIGLFGFAAGRAFDHQAERSHRTLVFRDGRLLDCALIVWEDGSSSLEDCRFTNG